jgi:uncharacterized membrane protein YqjE
MSPASNTLLALILVALGIIGIILSFLVPDRKKSFISLVMAGVVAAVGVIYFAAQSVSDFRWRRRLSDLREQRQIDLDKLKEDFKKRAADVTPPAAAQPKK